MVKLTFKTLQQKSFTLDADLSESIGAIKQKIEAAENFSVASQKLILKGKILSDDTLVSAIGAGEKDFIVVMVTKPKVVSTPVSAPIVPTAAASASIPAASVPIAQTASVVPNDMASFTELATGSSYELAVGNLVEMGFPRDQVVLAMRAAFNNPDRAAEYLMNGIPDSAQPQAAPQEAVPLSTPTPTEGGYVNLFQQAAEQQRAAPSPNTAVAGGPADLEAIRNSPQFQQLRQMVQSQPQLLPMVLQQLQQSNPQLVQLIAQNQDQFLAMLAEGGPPGMEGALGGEGGGLESGEQYISITEEENEAVGRLEGLGFDRTMALEAYLACDKNEEMAANYLFDQGADFQ